MSLRGNSLVILASVAALFAATSIARADAERGFHLSLGSTGHHLELESSAEETLAKAGIKLGTNGVGGELIAGYRFGPNLSLDLRIAGSELDSGAYGVDAGYGSATLQLVGFLRPGEKVQPYVVGGIGGAGIVLDGGDFDEESLEGSIVSLGVGVDVWASQRWVLGFDYRGSTIDLEATTIERSDAPDLAFDGNGISHEIGFRWGFRF